VWKRGYGILKMGRRGRSPQKAKSRKDTNKKSEALKGDRFGRRNKK
jgi:hypothetical protein